MGADPPISAAVEAGEEGKEGMSEPTETKNAALAEDEAEPAEYEGPIPVPNDTPSVSRCVRCGKADCGGHTIEVTVRTTKK